MSHSDINIQREMTHAKLTYMGVMTIQADWLLIFSNDSIESVDQNTLVNIIQQNHTEWFSRNFFLMNIVAKARTKSCMYTLHVYWLHNSH